MQNRIDRLENLVLSLMQPGGGVDAATAASAAGMVPGVRGPSFSEGQPSQASQANQASHSNPVDEADDSDIDDGLATSLGVLKVETDRSLYFGQEHWHTLLSDITEVKNYFIQHKKDMEKSYEKVLESTPATAREAPTFLLGAPATTEAALRAELPAKPTVLTLCGRYFNSMDNAVNIIHAPTFHAQLRRHWEDPSRTPIMWLGLLYSVLCLAMLSYHKVGDEPPEWKGRAVELASVFRVRTVQCLVTADYTKPVEYTVETMILYVFGEYSTRWDADLGLWLIGSLITRVAFRMGYHRDAKWFPLLTPFQAEMRRRTWALVRMCDVMFSQQVSLPNMIYEHDCDTQLPLNIFDTEFDASTKVLPPSRPLTEATPISYMITKVKLCQALGNILQATTRVGRPVPYDEILRLDSGLRQVRDEMPPHLKLQPLERSSDPLTLITARFNLDILYQKIMCLLHRKYLPRARQNPRYAQSRRAAIEASLATLHHLHTLNRESQPHGRLRSVRWYVSSIATKDFLLPATLIALEVRVNKVAQESGQTTDPAHPYFWTPEQRAEMVAVLETTKEIWRPMAENSMEAYKAYNIIRIVLERIQTPGEAAAAAAKQASPDTGASTASSCLGASKLTPASSLDTADAPDALPPPHGGAAAMPAGTLSEAGTLTSIHMLPSPETPSGLGGLYGTPGLLGTPYDSLDATMGNTLGGGDGGGGFPDVQTDMFGGMAGFALAAGGLSSGPGLLGENMDFAANFATNFDWDSLQNFAQSEPFGDTSFQLFPENQAGMPGMDENGNFYYGNTDGPSGN